jgi:integrase
MGPINETDYVGCAWKSEQGEGEWTGEDLKDIIGLMLYTGYRISDAVFFDMKRLQGNRIHIRAHKNGKPVFGVVPDWVRDRLLARAMRRSGRRDHERRRRGPAPTSLTNRLEGSGPVNCLVTNPETSMCSTGVNVGCLRSRTCCRDRLAIRRRFLAPGRR